MNRSDGAGRRLRQVPRHVAFAVLSALSLIVLHEPLRRLVNLAAHDDRYAYILLIPFISLYLFWESRRRIPAASAEGSSNRLLLGIPLLLIGIGLISMVPGGQDARFSATILGMVLVLTAEFVLCFGQRAFRVAIFPILLLFLITPLPAQVMDRAVLALQQGSADISYGLFKLVGIPVFRDGFRFSLPGVDIEVAAECSGIRSSLSLFLSSVLVGQLMLRSGWTQAAFTLLTIPVVIFKNAVRIVTISWLGVYVDPGFLHGNLHRYGGLPFSALAIMILFLVLLALQKAETSRWGDHSREVLVVAELNNEV